MNYTENTYWNLFSEQREHQFKVANTSASERIKKLNTLQRALEKTYRDKIRKALFKDFRKPIVETDLTEIYQVIGEIKLAKRSLRLWMKKKRIETPIALIGTTSWIQYEPKGVCLIISPWNFPITLTLGPLVSAIAAGNTVILKPSEMTPHTSAVMQEMVDDIFPDNEVALIQGEVEVSQELLKLPFNHIFFTGSPAVGKIVMEAASKHLTSVTLELGGKSPTIVDSTANLKTAAKRIAWGKFLNGGQICVSPDYVLVHEKVKDKLISALKDRLLSFYTEDISKSESFSRIVNKKHYQRLLNYLEDAKDKGGNFVFGGDHKEDENYIGPTIICDLPEKSLLLQEEIFGPILPIISYSTTEEAINYINKRENPLALYLYSKSRKTANQILRNTRAGSSAINTDVLQFANHRLPFGGVNNSGIGKGHGFYGFRAFSNERSVLKQHTIGLIELLFPPYTALTRWLANFTIKWL